MSPNPLQTDISPIPTQGRSFLQHHHGSLSMKETAPLSAPPSLHSLLLTQVAKKVEKPTHKTIKQVSDASDVAAEAMRITRESLQKEDLAQLRPNGELPKTPTSPRPGSSGGSRLNKFVRRLHDMLQAEKDGGIIEWRKGLLVLHSTADFAKNILPKYFNTRNFKTFRRQLNYYGFVHVRSFSTAAASTTALWVNQELAELGSADIGSVLTLKRVEPCELQKTAEGRRQRKEMAMHTVEEDLKIDPKTLQLEQIQNLARRGIQSAVTMNASVNHTLIPSIIAFPKSTCSPLSSSSSLQQRHHQAPMDNVVSDDTQSRSSSTASLAERHNETVEDNMGAANLLLLLSKAGC